MTWLVATLAAASAGTAAALCGVHASAVATEQAQMRAFDLSGDEIDQAVVSVNATQYYLLLGDWERNTVGAVERCIPSGSGTHAIELGWTATEHSTVTLPTAGEIDITSNAIFVDRIAQGAIKFGAFDVSSLPPTCDATWSNVTHTSFSGGCWGPLFANPETGVWSKKCDKGNSMGCTATMTLVGGAHQNETFSCEGGGGSMSGNSVTQIANVFGASNNPCQSNIDSQLRGTPSSR
jgi:hypothetical protein